MSATKAKPKSVTRGDFPCPECDFVAKHAMGLGRHRSSRHGVIAKTAALRQDNGVAPGAVVPGARRGRRSTKFLDSMADEVRRLWQVEAEYQQASLMLRRMDNQLKRLEEANADLRAALQEAKRKGSGEVVYSTMSEKFNEQELRKLMGSKR